MTPTELTATSPDGHEIHGFVLTPAGEGPHPVLLTIHGGPYASYPSTFFDEWQVYVEAGYAVVACNPRGSAGYGQAHGAAIRHDLGNLDMVDVLAFLDHAIATLPRLDGQRVGVMGGSYGGYLTAWLIAHDHRFAGAIVERGFLDPASFVGASDIGWFFADAYNGAQLAQQNAQSPMLLTDRVRTPTFVVHSELDLRCPLGQALRYYALLKKHGVETELLVFPGENHELSRSGSPWHRRQRFEKILAWWERHLPVDAPGTSAAGAVSAPGGHE
ncbi:MAG: alpha/beta fold hydrolase [Propionibacteriaceae bacterium]|nr:alpha/beta fold hydrolase [Propionibacteriaceae bacterium]